MHLVNTNSEKKTEILELEPKTKSSKRTIPIPSSIINELLLHMERQNIEKSNAYDFMLTTA